MKDILKNVHMKVIIGFSIVLASCDFHCIDEHCWNIQNIFFFAPGLERHEDERMMSEVN